jgi:hypothetical protein
MGGGVYDEGRSGRRMKFCVTVSVIQAEYIKKTEGIPSLNY